MGVKGAVYVYMHCRGLKFRDGCGCIHLVGELWWVFFFGWGGGWIFFLYGFHVCKDLIFYGEGVGLLWWVSM